MKGLLPSGAVLLHTCTHYSMLFKKPLKSFYQRVPFVIIEQQAIYEGIQTKHFIEAEQR